MPKGRPSLDRPPLRTNLRGGSRVPMLTMVSAWSKAVPLATNVRIRGERRWRDSSYCRSPSALCRHGRTLHQCHDCRSCTTPPRIACGAVRRACMDRAFIRVVRDDHVASAHRDCGSTPDACVRLATVHVPHSIVARPSRRDDATGTPHAGAQEPGSSVRHERITRRSVESPTRDLYPSRRYRPSCAPSQAGRFFISRTWEGH